jgi:rhodanese-related sulfurtransferase
VTVETLEETHLIIISKDQFDEILKKYPNASIAFARQMSKYFARNIQVIKKTTERRFRVSRTSWIDFAVIFFLSLLFAGIFNQSNPNGINLAPKPKADKVFFVLEPSLAVEKHKKGDALFVDARPQILYEQMHIKNAENIPLALFEIIYMIRFGKIDKAKELIIYGRTISRHYDEHVAAKLFLRGHSNVMLLKGGLSELKENGYPIEP